MISDSSTGWFGWPSYTGTAEWNKTMLGMTAALVTVLAWGTWLAPSQNVPFPRQQVRTFYVASANLVLAALVTFTLGGSGITVGTFILPFLGGLIWSVSGLCAFTATEKMGIAGAFGVWAPLNIIVSIFWGAVLFGEFLHFTPITYTLFFMSLAIIIVGVSLIIRAKGERALRLTPKDRQIGLLCAVGAGILWGTYYIPIQMSESSLWVASFPLAVGIFTGSTLLALFPTRLPLALPGKGAYARVILTGLLWGIGNYSMLILVQELGAGRGFTISQLSVVVNALIGIFLLKEPRPGTRAAAFTLIGCILATIGGILLGNLK